MAEQIHQDGFSRADGAIGTCDGGGTLDPEDYLATSTWVVASSLAACTDGAFSGCTLSAVANIQVSAQYMTASENFIGICWRYQNDDNCIRALVENDNTLAVSTCIGGVNNYLSGSGTHLISEGDYISITHDGSNLVLFVNFIPVDTYTLAYSPGTRAGMYASLSTGRLDNLDITALGTSGGGGSSDGELEASIGKGQVRTKKSIGRPPGSRPGHGHGGGGGTPPPPGTARIMEDNTPRLLEDNTPRILEG